MRRRPAGQAVAATAHLVRFEYFIFRILLSVYPLTVVLAIIDFSNAEYFFILVPVSYLSYRTSIISSAFHRQITAVDPYLIDIR